MGATPIDNNDADGKSGKLYGWLLIIRCTRPEWDIRLYTDVPRGTDAYKKIYNQRTTTERINNRILNDYGLHRMFIHTKKHYSFRTTMIGVYIHLDACYKQQIQAVT